jgi:hypothetical protein
MYIGAVVDASCRVFTNKIAFWWGADTSQMCPIFFDMGVGMCVRLGLMKQRPYPVLLPVIHSNGLKISFSSSESLLLTLPDMI